MTACEGRRAVGMHICSMSRLWPRPQAHYFLFPHMRKSLGMRLYRSKECRMGYVSRA